MRGLTFTPDNLTKVFDGSKTMTRRMHKEPWYKVGDIVPINEPLTRTQSGMVSYKADNVLAASVREWKWQNKTLPSMFMPNWAARKHVIITSVKQEPIQSISAVDIIAEGVRLPDGDEHRTFVAASLRAAWIELWDSIYAKKPNCSWDANPSPIAYGWTGAL